MRKRVALALLAASLGAVLIAKTNWSPICAAFGPDDPLYWVFMCWDGPPKPPEA